MRQAALADQGQRCAVPIPRGHVRRPSCPLTLTRQQRMPPVVSPLGPARGARASHRHGPPQWSGSSQCMPDAAMAAEVHVAVDSAPDAGATPQLGHLMHTAVAVARAPVAPAASTTSIPAGWPVPSVPVPSPAAVEKTLPRGVPKSRGRGFFSRLLTHLDPLRLHAVSGALHLVLSTGAVIHILGHTLVFGVNPYPLHDLIIPTLFATSLVMNCTGVQMAVTHRRGVLQRLFYASALVSFAGHLFLWYFDTSFPASAVAHHLARAAIVVWMPLCTWLGLIDPLVNLNAVLATRDVRPREQAQQGSTPSTPPSSAGWATAQATSKAAASTGQDLHASAGGVAVTGQLLSHGQALQALQALSRVLVPQRLLEYVAYALPAVLPSWIMLVTATLMVLGGDGVKPMLYAAFPHFRQAGYAWGILGLWAGLLGTFAATLRDRGLINRPTEMAMVGLPFGLFLALVAYSIVRMDDAWDLMRSIADPVYVMQVVRMVRLQVA